MKCDKCKSDSVYPAIAANGELIYFCEKCGYEQEHTGKRVL